MIVFAKKTDLPPASPDAKAENRFEHIRKTAAQKHKKSDTDATRRDDRPAVEDDKLL